VAAEVALPDVLAAFHVLRDHCVIAIIAVSRHDAGANMRAAARADGIALYAVLAGRCNRTRGAIVKCRVTSTVVNGDGTRRTTALGPLALLQPQTIRKTANVRN
jgi:hypothetical protein